MNIHSIVKQRQEPLMQTYAKDPAASWITDIATIEDTNPDDPFHTLVAINEEMKFPFRVGVHRAVGGFHDCPNPGDLLCASLSSCFETTLRLIANRLDIELIKTKVKASAFVDVRGTLMVDRDVPVGFQKMSLQVEVTLDNTVKPELVQKLLKGTEKCCIVYQTIAKGIPVSIQTKILQPALTLKEQ